MIAGQPPSDPSQPRFASLNLVTPEYLTLGIRTVRGRAFSVLDRALGRRTDGLIGRDFLERYVVAVDYAARTVAAYEPAAPSITTA